MRSPRTANGYQLKPPPYSSDAITPWKWFDLLCLPTKVALKSPAQKPKKRAGTQGCVPARVALLEQFLSVRRTKELEILGLLTAPQVKTGRDRHLKVRSSAAPLRRCPRAWC